MTASSASPGHVGVALGAMVALAALDLVGAVFARHWATHRAPLALVAGAVVFGVLFLVYARSLHYADLTTVTIGWVVLLQVGVVVLERIDGVRIPPAKLGVIVAILGLQVVLTLGALGDTADHPPAPVDAQPTEGGGQAASSVVSPAWVGGAGSTSDD